MLSISFLSSNYDLDTTVKKIDDLSIDFIHVDLMDGVFVPNKSFSKEDLKRVLSNTKSKLDAHLMVSNPLSYIDFFSDFNTEYLTFHLESKEEPISVINAIKDKNMKVGIAINPDTDIEEIKPFLNIIDLVLVMSVYPGAGGQSFIKSSLDKIKELNSLKGNFLISVDGGINDTTAPLVKEAKADILVVGSYICRSDNFKERVENLK